MSRETGTQGRAEVVAYKNDPDNVESPTGNHKDIEKQHNAEMLISQESLETNVTNLLLVALTADQKASFDAANAPDATNAVATIADLTSQVSAVQTAYVFRTATDAPADTEIKMNSVTPASVTVVNVANINKNGLNMANLLLGLESGDAIVIADNDDSTKAYNFDVSGAVSQIGGSGSGGYLAIPVTFFAQGTGGTIADSETVNLLAKFSGSSSAFLVKLNNLSDLDNATTARTNLSVYSTAQVDTAVGLRLLKTNNLSDLASAATGRTNLDVYSKGEIDAQIDDLSGVTDPAGARTNLDVYSKSEVDAKVGINKTKGGGVTSVLVGTPDQIAVIEDRLLRLEFYGIDDTNSQQGVTIFNIDETDSTYEGYSHRFTTNSPTSGVKTRLNGTLTGSFVALGETPCQVKIRLTGGNIEFYEDASPQENNFSYVWF